MLKANDLGEHLKKYKNATLIVGSLLNNSIMQNVGIREYFKTVKHKNFIRNNKSFWDFYDKNFYSNTAIPKQYATIKKLVDNGIISNIITQQNDGYFNTKYELLGNIKKANCKKCGLVDLIKDKNNNFVCSKCNSKDIKPAIKFVGDKFDTDQLNEMYDILKESNTLIVLDVDFLNMEIVNDLMMFFSDSKEHNPNKLLVAIQEKSNPFDINKEITFCDFYVRDKDTNESLNRLLDLTI